MDFISPILHFLTDSSRRLTSKAVLVISFLLILAFADNITGFSFYYNTENKLVQLKDINSLIKDTSLTNEVKQKLLILRNDIIMHQSIKDKVYSYITNISFSNQKRSITKENNRSTQIELNPTWHLLTSGFIIFILMIGLPFTAIADKTQSLGKSLLILLIVEPILFAIAVGLAKLFSLIPVLFGLPFINYSLNIVLNIAGIASLIIFAQKRSKAESNG